MSEFFEWLSQSPQATSILLLGFILIVMLFVIGFIQGREIFFWPPRIGPRPCVEKRFPNDEETELIPVRGPFFDKPLQITVAKNNRQHIDSAILSFLQCTILMWILIPPKREGLRNSPNNRYLLAHHTGSVDTEGSRFYNRFCLRHLDSTAWSVVTSNNRAQYSSPLKVADGLESGWHHFALAWNREEPIITLLIDNGRNGNGRSRSVENWPEKLGDSVTVGAWQNDTAVHYCETKLYNLVVFDSFISPTHPAFSSHYRKKPI